VVADIESTGRKQSENEASGYPFPLIPRKPVHLVKPEKRPTVAGPLLDPDRPLRNIYTFSESSLEAVITIEKIPLAVDLVDRDRAVSRYTLPPERLGSLGVPELPPHSIDNPLRQLRLH
jgi:hypothetical protein